MLCQSFHVKICGLCLITMISSQNKFFGAIHYSQRVLLWGISGPALPAMGAVLTRRVPLWGAALVRHLIYVDHVQYSSSTFVLDGPSFQPNTRVWFIMSITHCIIMVMHAMLFIMAGLVRLPASSSCRSFRNEFSGFGVFMLNPISVCGMPSASGCDILVSHAVFGCHCECNWRLPLWGALLPWRVPLWGAPLSPRQLCSDIWSFGCILWNFY